MNERHPAGGYVALMSVLILTTILTVMVFASGTSAFLARFDTLDHEDYLQAQLYARSCISAALYSLAKDHAYRQDSPVRVTLSPAGATCTIEKVQEDGTTRHVVTSATMRATESTLEAEIDILSATMLPTLRSWKEINSP